MSGRLRWLCPSLLVGLAVIGTGVGRAADPPPADDTARLQALLEAQQRQIQRLEERLAAAEQNDTDRARVDVLRQQIREILSEREFRDSLMPTTAQVGYDKGFYIRSTDEKFKMQFNGLFQFRFTHYGTRSTNRYLAPGFQRDDRTGFDFARVRFQVSGHAFDPKLTYLMEFESTPDGAARYDTGLKYGWINYRFVDEFQFMAGIMRLASMRASFGSTRAFHTIDYPTLTEPVFGLGDGLGVRFWGHLLNKRGAYYLDIVNSFNSPGTRTITNDEDLFTNGHDNNPAIVLRTVWALLEGESRDKPEGGSTFWANSDSEYHTAPAWEIGFHYGYTEDRYDGNLRIPFPRRTFFAPGGFGLTTSDGLQIHQFGLDTGFKFMGFSLTAEYVGRVLDVRDGTTPPLTPLFQLTGDGSTNVQHGGYVECGYFLPIPGLERKFEVVGRVEGITTNSGGVEGTWAYTGGLNYYFEGHRVKLQTDLTKVSEVPISSPTHSLANVNDDALIWRTQLQVAF